MQLKRYAFTTLATVLLAVIIACTPVEQDARNTAAALGGVLIAAQTQNQSCVTDSAPPACTLINQGIAAQNALITAAETYCGWSTVSPPADPNAKCVPVKSAQAALTAAIGNAVTMTTEIKGAIK
jgi:hypothetical protein